MIHPIQAIDILESPASRFSPLVATNLRPPLAVGGAEAFSIFSRVLLVYKFSKAQSQMGAYYLRQWKQWLCTRF